MKNQLLKITLIALLSSLAFANSELERQCNNGNAGSCVKLGFLYYNGDGVKQDYKKAREFYNKACEMGEALGCSALGDLYYNVKQDYKKAREFWSKACEMGDANGCVLLGFLYQYGEGVRKDYNKAMEFFGKACDLGEQKGCDKYKEIKLNP